MVIDKDVHVYKTIANVGDIMWGVIWNMSALPQNRIDVWDGVSEDIGALNGILSNLNASLRNMEL